MPKELEKQLKQRARNKGLVGERADKYVYGTMRKAGWNPGMQSYGSGDQSKKEIYKKIGALGKKPNLPPGLTKKTDSPRHAAILKRLQAKRG